MWKYRNECIRLGNGRRTWTISALTTLTVAGIFLAPARAERPDIVWMAGGVGRFNLVAGLDVSPDGTIIARGGTDRVVKLWRPSDGRLLRSMKGHTDWVYDVAFSRDGELLASVGDRDHAVRLWSPLDGRSLGILEGPEGNWMVAVAFSPDGRLIASGDQTGWLHVWRSQDRELERSIHTAALGLSQLAFSPDASMVAVGTVSQGGVEIWNITTGELVRRMESQAFYGDGVDWSPDGQWIAHSEAGGPVRLYRASDGELVHTLLGHNEVGAVRFSPDGRTLVSSSWDGTTKFWKIPSGELVRTLESAGFAAAFSPNGNELATSSDAQPLKWWRTSDGELLWSTVGHTWYVYGASFSPDGLTLATASGTGPVGPGEIKQWDVASGRLIRTLTGHTDQVYTVAHSPDGTTLASGAFDDSIRIWDAHSGQHVRTLSGHTNDVASVAFSPDSELLASGSWDTTVRIWRVSDGVPVHTLTGHTDLARSVAFSRDGTILASGGFDRTIKLWRVEDGSLLASFEAHSAGVRAVVYSPDGALLASASVDQTIKVWDASTLELIRTMAGHTAGVRSIAFSADGKTIISGADDATVRLWDVTAGELLKTYDEETGTGVLTVGFSPDQRRFSFGRWDATVVMAYNPDAPGGECGPDAVLTAKCIGGGVKVTGLLKKATPDTPVTFTIDGESPVEATTNRKGKAKVKYTDQAPGPHTVGVCGLEAGC